MSTAPQLSNDVLDAETLAGLIAESIQTVTAPLVGRIKALELRVDIQSRELDTKALVTFEGTWTADRSYRRGQTVIRNGSL